MAKGASGGAAQGPKRDYGRNDVRDDFMQRLGKPAAANLDAELNLHAAIASYTIDRWSEELDSEAKGEDQADADVIRRLNVISNRHLHDIEVQAAARLEAFVNKNTRVVSIESVKEEIGRAKWERTWSGHWWFAEGVKALFGLAVIIVAGTFFHWFSPRVEAESDHNKKLITGTEESPNATGDTKGIGQPKNIDKFPAKNVNAVANNPSIDAKPDGRGPRP